MSILPVCVYSLVSLACADLELRAAINQHARGDEQRREADSLPAGVREQYRQEYGTLSVRGSSL
jgi:hypothetical protein